MRSRSSYSDEYGGRETAHDNLRSVPAVPLGPRPPRPPQTEPTGRPRSASLKRKKQWIAVDMMSSSNKAKASSVVRMLQEYGVEKIESLEEFASQLERYAVQDREERNNAKDHGRESEQGPVTTLCKEQQQNFNDSQSLSSSFLSELNNSLTFSGSATDASTTTANGDFQPSDACACACPKPPLVPTMDGCWKLVSASEGVANISNWLQRLCIINGQVRDGTGIWKALKMLNGVAYLDGGALHLENKGLLRRYGKKGDTFVCFKRDRAHCRVHSPRSSPGRRIQCEVCL